MMVTETMTTSRTLSTGSGSSIGSSKMTRRPSFKSRSSISAPTNGVGNANVVNGYNAIRVTVPPRVVTELASKFNAVVVDASKGATNRQIVHKVNKTLAKGAAVRATVEKFESVKMKPPIVVVRTNSDANTVDKRKISEKSIVKQRMEIFQKTSSAKPDVVAPSKPKVGPKPDVTTLCQLTEDRKKTPKTVVDKITPESKRFSLTSPHNRLSIARDPDAQLESVLNMTPSQSESSDPLSGLHRPPTKSRIPPETKASQSLATESKFQSFSESSKSQLPVESRLLSPPEPKSQSRPENVQQARQNESFLHGRKTTPTATPTAENDKRWPNALENAAEPQPQQKPPSSPSADDFVDQERPLNRSSFLHGYKKKANECRPTEIITDDGRGANGDSEESSSSSEPQQAIYEELCDIQLQTRSKSAQNLTPKLLLPDVVLESSYYNNSSAIVGDHDDDDDDDDDYHYATIESVGQQNIYDDVNVAAVTAAGADDNSYETVEAPVVPVTLSAPPLLPAVGVHPEKKPPSDGDSMEVDNSIYGLNPPSESTSSGVTSDSTSADRNSKFDLDEEWVDVGNASDEPQEIIIFQPKPKNNDIISSGWSVQIQKQISKANEIKEKANTTSQNIPEEIYADYDSFSSDDSWDDFKDERKFVSLPYPCKNRDLPAPPNQQNENGIIPLVKRAKNRMKNRWNRLGTLGQYRIKILNVINSTTDIDKNERMPPNKVIENKTTPSERSNSLGSSTFYLNESIYNNIKYSEKGASVQNPTKKPPSSIDSRRLSLARPSSPPPPPPPTSLKRHSTGSQPNGSLIYSNYNFQEMPSTLLDKINTESMSETGSNQGSDLYMRFADEPFYQFYTADLSERSKSVFADDIIEECEGYEEICSTISNRPSALELITPCESGHGQHRSLWGDVPEVKNSGILDTLQPRERKLQEAKFELITSEASYFKSLTVLEKHFVNSHSLNDETILDKNSRKILFENVNPVRKCSEKLLAALEKCWQEDILLKGLCEILYTHSKENFKIFIKYCSNQIYLDRTLKSLREKNVKFNDALQMLESDSKCQSLSLHSFLMLPMQRITRLPLLVDAILSRMDSTEYPKEYQMCELTLSSLNAIVQNCNESTRTLERYEEMLLLSRQLEFSNKKEMKAMSVASSSRWLVRSGSMVHLPSPDAKLTLSRKLIRPTKRYFFLFNDMFFVAKRKSEENYTVVDYCARNFVQMEDADFATELVITSSYKHLLKLTILENHEAKTIEMLLSCDSDSSKKRWIEAMSPPISSNPEETLYNEWDCPQVFTEHEYTAIQPDELSLQKGDIVKVLTKMNDGWYHGERIRDGEKGWFPANYTSEIASQHARAKNLKQRYRLLAMSGSYLQSQQDKIKKK